MTYDVIITCFMLKPKPRELEFRMMAQIKAWCLENKMKHTRKFFAYTFNANSRDESRDESWLLRKVSWLWKKAIFLPKPKNWLPSEGRSDSKSILYYTLKKTDIKFERGDCEWRVGSILSTQYWLLSPRYGYWVESIEPTLHSQSPRPNFISVFLRV